MRARLLITVSRTCAHEVMIHVPMKREAVNIQIGPVMSRIAPVATHKTMFDRRSSRQGGSIKRYDALTACLLYKRDWHMTSPKTPTAD